jgi:hypothetical protein
MLLAELRTALREAEPASPVPDSAESGARLQALRALEEDILRLERLLQGIL